MNRGSLLLVLGVGSLVAALAAQGCSSGSSGGGTTATDGGGTHDGTASSSGAEAGSSSGTEAGSSSGTEAGSSSGTEAGSGSGGEAGGDAASCPSAAVIPDPTLRACVSANCCNEWSACIGDNACIAIAQCYQGCISADGGTVQGCTAECEADAGATAANEFNAFGVCVSTNCSGGPVDAGGQ